MRINRFFIFSALAAVLFFLAGCRRDDVILLQPKNSTAAQAALQDWQSLYNIFLLADSVAKNPAQINSSCWQLTHDTAGNIYTTTIRFVQQVNCNCYDSSSTRGVIRVIRASSYPSLTDTVKVELVNFQTGLCVYNGELRYRMNNFALQQFEISFVNLQSSTAELDYKISGSVDLERYQSPGINSGQISATGDLVYKTEVQSRLQLYTNELRSANYFVSGEVNLIIGDESFMANYGNGADDNLVTVITSENFRYIVELSGF